MIYLAGIYTVLTSILWTFMYRFILKQLRSAPKIGEVDASEPDSYPSLSILVTACNEEDSIEYALTSLLKQDYPEKEIIIVNDRSTDQTGAIIERLTNSYPELKCVHIDHLPENWLGKTHALKKGYEQATGEWVLFTDADVWYRQGALKRIMAVAIHEGLDHISCFPQVKNNGFWHEVAFSGWFNLAVGFQNLQGVQDTESNDYFALGAFNMVRRQVFDRTEGFSWLRMEIADDMGVARLMRDQKARQGFFLATSELKLEWFGSLKRMIAGLEKNSIAVVAHYSYLRGYLLPFIWAIFFFGPIAGLFMPWIAVKIISVVFFALYIPLNIAIAKRLNRPILPYLLSHIGKFFPMYSLFRSTHACARRRGVLWRGTLYPVQTLRKYQRVRF